MTPQRLQFLGLTLAVCTAIGSMGYERMVMKCSMASILAVNLAAQVVMLAVFLCLHPDAISSDLVAIRSSGSLQVSVLVNFVTYASCPIWFWITKQKGVMVGAIFEMKYVLLLALFSCLMGTKPITPSTLLGLTFAVASIYFVTQ